MRLYQEAFYLQDIKKAPPAVETKLKLLTAFKLFNKETVSPPPATEKILFVLLFSIIFAILILPLAKFGFKISSWSFHNIVLLLSIIFVILFIVLDRYLISFHQIKFYLIL